MSDDLFDMDDFFQPIDTNPKCAKCSLHSKKSGSLIKRDKVLIYETGKEIDILLVLENYNTSYVNFIREYFKRKGIYRFAIVAGLMCENPSGEMTSPITPVYCNCNALPDEIITSLKPKVIMTAGRGMYAVTQADDLISWQEFWEYKFNQTYFYTSFNSQNKIRVYPIPDFSDWVDENYHVIDKYESYFVTRQISTILHYLNYFQDYDKIPPCNIQLVKNFRQFTIEHKDDPVAAIDTETNTLIPFIENTQVSCITMSFDGMTGYYIPTANLNWHSFFQFIKDKKQIWANGKYDWEMLEREAIKANVECTCRIDGDVPVLFHLLNSERTLNSIKSLAWLIGFGGYDGDLDRYKHTYKIENYLEIPEEILVTYSTLDAIVTLRLHLLGEKLLNKQPHLKKLYYENNLPVIEVFKAAEENGMEIDFNYLNKLDAELAQEMRELELKISDKLGGNIKVSSSSQLGRRFEELNFVDFGRSGKQKWVDDHGKAHGYYKTGEEKLKLWKGVKYEDVEATHTKEEVKLMNEIASLLLDWRALSKLRTTFVGSIDEDKEEVEEEFFTEQEEITEVSTKNKGLIKVIRFDKKIHSQFNAGRTMHYRSTCHSPNLAQFPKDGIIGKRFRPVLLCPEDYYIGEADMSGFQLRIAAIYSGDENMMDVFLNQSGDLHSMTSVKIFARDMSLEEFMKVKGKDPYKLYRKRSKNINFGFTFGLAAITFIETLKDSWTKEEILEYIRENDLELLIHPQTKLFDEYFTVASDIREKFFIGYPQLKQHIFDRHNEAEKNGCVVSWHGFVRHLPYLTHIGDKPNWANVSNFRNAAVNSAIQSFEAYHIYDSMIKIYKKLKERNMKSKIVGMIHDSIVFYVHKTEVRLLKSLTSECMDNSTDYSIPLLSEFGYGKILGFPEYEITNNEELEISLIKEKIQNIQRAA